MPCCHVDFAFNESSDKAFTVGMPTFTFGAGCLAEAGEHARELSLRRVALFTDRGVAASPHLGVVRDALAAAGVDAIVYDEVSIEPTTASFKAAAKFAAEGDFDGYVSVGGGSVIDTCVTSVPRTAATFLSRSGTSAAPGAPLAAPRSKA